MVLMLGLMYVYTYIHTWVHTQTYACIEKNMMVLLPATTTKHLLAGLRWSPINMLRYLDNMYLLY